MNRNAFGAWGLELTDDEFAQALAVLGIAGPWRPLPTGKSVPDRKFIISRIRSSCPIEWYFDADSISKDTLRWDGSDLAYIWQSVTDKYGEKTEPAENETRPHDKLLTIEVDPSRGLGNSKLTDLLWVIKELSRPSVKASSVYIRNYDETNNVIWDYPLRIGFLGDDKSRQLRSDLEGLKFLGQPLAGTHIKIVEIKAGKTDCEILLLPHDLRAAAIALIEAPNALRADLVIVTGAVDEAEDRMAPLLESIRTQARASGVCLLPMSPSKIEGYYLDRRQVWFKELIREVSHNCSIDVALFRSGRHPEVLSAPPVIYATRKLIQSSRISHRIEQFSKQMAYNYRRPALSFPRDRTEPSKAEETKKRLKGNLNQLNWTRESGSARDFSLAKSAILETLENVAPPPPKERWIQTEIWEHAEGKRHRNMSDARALGQNTTYSVDVFIGRKSSLAVSADKPFDDSLLPPGKNEHQLTVIFTEPKISPKPQVAKIKLPRTGDSSRCEFFIHIPEKIDGIEARIIVAYKNRILQTALLMAPVLAGTKGVAGDKGIQLLIESALRPGLQDLSERKWFDAAFVVNHDSSGASQITRFAGDRAELIYIDGIQEKIKWFDETISEVAEKWEKFENLSSKKSQDLLKNCALNGAVLYEVLTDSAVHGFLSSTERIQMLSAKRGSRFPLEFVYSKAAPEQGAELCPNAEKALLEGHCGKECPTGKNEKTVVCPFGFWGLNRVIERHVYDVRASRDMASADFALQSEPVDGRNKLNILQKAVVAASDNVDSVVPGSLKKITDALELVTKKQSELVNSWQDWEKNIVGRSPSLLVLLPHTLNDLGTGQPMLEIGADERLLFANLDKEYVLGPNDDDPSPLVILMGCKTAAPDIPYESFVEKFRMRGAALVVGTGSTILGRHASPVAAAFVKAIADRDPGNISFGDVMLQVRRKMVAEGLLMALCLTSYGDTDWEI